MQVAFTAYASFLVYDAANECFRGGDHAHNP